MYLMKGLFILSPSYNEEKIRISPYGFSILDNHSNLLEATRVIADNKTLRVPKGEEVIYIVYINSTCFRISSLLA